MTTRPFFGDASQRARPRGLEAMTAKQMTAHVRRYGAAYCATARGGRRTILKMEGTWRCDVASGDTWREALQLAAKKWDWEHDLRVGVALARAIEEKES